VGGIMNGTCNYILDSMTRLGQDYAEALAEAQKLGYAEANPTTDVEGIDTWHKVILSSNIGFGVTLDKETVPVAGISRITKEDVNTFHAHGLVCKLISTGKQTEGAYSAYVQPTLVSATSLEAAVPANYNLITFEGEASGRMSFYGQGAGRYPTAHNVVQDCADVMAGKGFYSPYGETVRATNEDRLQFYVRGNADAWLQSHTSQNWGSGVVTTPVCVSEMHKWLKDHEEAFIAAIAE
jgi:homoserine dehydrogenase